MTAGTDYGALAADLGITGRTAGRNLYGRCPLHHDRSPSFSLNVTNGLWICFAGCGQGDFLQLVKEVLACSTREAEVWLAGHRRLVGTEKLAADLAEATAPVGPRDGPEPWSEAFEVLDRGALPTWYFKRGFTWATADEWDLRWDPVAERLVIPVRDERERLVGTIARSSHGEPKYVNSPGLPVTRLLYPLRPTDRNRPIILVEGPLDALWLRQLGKAGTAILGTNMSLAQVAVLQRWGIPRVYLAFDDDPPGRAARTTHMERLRSRGWSFPGQLLGVVYPRGCKDVQECTAEEVERMIAEAKEV